MDESQFEELLKTNDEALRKLHMIVKSSMKDESLIVRKLAKTNNDTPTFGQKIADKVAQFGGSWTFIIYFGIVLTVWIVFNSIATKNAAFDPYPFILMNLVLSCLAALQAPIIMMSQNRQEEKDRKRAENDYLVNLKAELEVRKLHRKIDLLLEDQIVKLMESQALQIKILEELAGKAKTETRAAKTKKQ